MFKSPKLRPYWIRLFWVSLVSLIITAGFNEGVYLMTKTNYDRAPQTMTLVIPPGTAEKVAAGESEPTIPSEMSFVVGDLLVVKNQDSVSHQLGPIWVPAGAVGRVTMETADTMSYTCSFRPSRYLGVDIRPSTTMGTRLVALGLTFPTMAALLFLYSIVAIPIKGPNENEAVA